MNERTRLKMHGIKGPGHYTTWNAHVSHWCRKCIHGGAR
jgi:hypothetical protein